MNKLLTILSGIALLIVLALVGYYGGIFGNKVQANYQKRVVTYQVQQNVRTPEFAQQVYEQFFTDCNDVVADNAKIAQAQARVQAMESLPNDAFGQKATKIADAQSDLTGLQQIQADTAAQYNAAAAEYTRGQFLAATLPAHLDPPYSVVCQ